MNNQNNGAGGCSSIGTIVPNVTTTSRQYLNHRFTEYRSVKLCIIQQHSYRAVGQPYLSVSTLRDLLKVILRSGCNFTKKYLLGDASTESHAHSIQQLERKLIQVYMQEVRIKVYSQVNPGIISESIGISELYSSQYIILQRGEDETWISCNCTYNAYYTAKQLLFVYQPALYDCKLQTGKIQTVDISVPVRWCTGSSP